MRIKKRNKIIMVLCAVIVAISIIIVPSAFALTVQTGTSTQPYYIVVGARQYDFVDVYVDNNTNTVMWVFDRDILSLAIFNDYNYVACGMNGSFIQTDVATDYNYSFMIGAFFDSRYLPNTNTFNFASSTNWQPYLYYDSNLGYSSARSLSYTALSTSYAYTQLPRMSKGSQYFDQAIEEADYWKPCLIIHLSQSFNIDYFADYACIGAGIQLIEITEQNAFQSGYESGYNQAIVNNTDNYNNGYNNGYANGIIKGEENKTTYGEEEYERGKQDGVEQFKNNELQNYESTAYNNGWSEGREDYIDNVLPLKEAEAEAKGRREQLQEGSNTFTELFSAIFDAPVKTLTGLLDFDLLGTNMSKFFLSILSLAVIICLVRWLI